jgi:hypothetical protein
MSVKSYRLTNTSADLHCSANFFSYVVIAFDSFTTLRFLPNYHRHSLVIMRTNVSQKLAELKIMCSYHPWLINKSTLCIRVCFQAGTHAEFRLNIHCYIPMHSLLKLLLRQQCNRHLFCLSCYSPSLSRYNFHDRFSVTQFHSSIRRLVFI